MSAREDISNFLRSMKCGDIVGAMLHLRRAKEHNFMCGPGMPAFTHFSFIPNSKFLVECLIIAGANVNQLGHYIDDVIANHGKMDCTPIINAVLIRNLDMIEVLLEYGANPNVMYPTYKKTLISYFVYGICAHEYPYVREDWIHWAFKVLHILLRSKVDLGMKNEDGSTALTILEEYRDNPADKEEYNRLVEMINLAR